jgi:predicted transcriptional regulator
MNKPILPHAIPAKDQAAYRTAVSEGIDAADAGRLTPFEPVAEWLASWGTEDEPPPPK